MRSWPIWVCRCLRALHVLLPLAITTATTSHDHLLLPPLGYKTQTNHEQPKQIRNALTVAIYLKSTRVAVGATMPEKPDELPAVGEERVYVKPSTGQVVNMFSQDTKQLQVHTCTCMHIHAHTCTCMHTYMCIHAHTHTTHAYRHTHIQAHT